MYSCISLLSDHHLPLQPLAGYVYRATAVERSQHPSNPETTAPKPEAYLHPIYITATLEWKYNGNKTDIARFITFRFKFSRFRFFLFFLFQFPFFVNGIKIFPLTDISVFVSVNVNHTEMCAYGPFKVRTRDRNMYFDKKFVRALITIIIIPRTIFMVLSS